MFHHLRHMRPDVTDQDLGRVVPSTSLVGDPVVDWMGHVGSVWQPLSCVAVCSTPRLWARKVAKQTRGDTPIHFLNLTSAPDEDDDYSEHWYIDALDFLGAHTDVEGLCITDANATDTLVYGASKVCSILQGAKRLRFCRILLDDTYMITSSSDFADFLASFLCFAAEAPALQFFSLAVMDDEDCIRAEHADFLNEALCRGIIVEFVVSEWNPVEHVVTSSDIPVHKPFLWRTQDCEDWWYPDSDLCGTAQIEPPGSVQALKRLCGPALRHVFARSVNTGWGGSHTTAYAFLPHQSALRPLVAPSAHGTDES